MSEPSPLEKYAILRNNIREAGGVVGDLNGPFSEVYDALEALEKRLEKAFARGFWTGHTEGRLFAAGDTGRLDSGMTRDELQRATRQCSSGYRAFLADVRAKESG
jgi:hypothetical protein